MAQARGLVTGSDADQIQEEAFARDTARKQEVIVGVLSAREAASGRRFSPELRQSLAAKLSSAPITSLEAFANAGGLGNIDALVTNSLGDSAADLVFTPVTPCRIVNTVATATPLAANTTRAFYVNGNTAAVFEAQGGNAGGCGIPDAATAVEMNFISVAPAAAGDFRAFPWAAGTPTPPLASVLNYANLGSLNIANGIAQPVCNAATTACTFDLIVQADAGQSHLIIDVVGYYKSVPKSQQNAQNFTSNTINAITQVFVPGLNSIAVGAGETVRETAGFGVFANSTTLGVACGGGCTTIRGEVTACYRPTGGGTPVLGNQVFFWDTAANYPGGTAPARKGGMFVHGVFTIATAGNYDFGICGRRDTSVATDADWFIFYPSVVVSRP